MLTAVAKQPHVCHNIHIHCCMNLRVLVLPSILIPSCSLRRQVLAINKLHAAGMFFWDYGNAFLLEASRAGWLIYIALYSYQLVQNLYHAACA